MTRLPAAYAWLANEPGPRILTEFLKVFGVAERPGAKSNPEILRWAREVGLARVYAGDHVAWCGLAMAYVAGQAGWETAPRGNALWALNWAHWGAEADRPMLGDVLVYKRAGGGHVGLYVGEDAEAFHTLGGNQDNEVNIRRKPRNRLVAVRRCPWRISEPENVRPILLSATGKLSNVEG